MNEETDRRPEKSEGFQNFEAGLKQILTVSKEDLNRQLAEEKQKRKRRPATTPKK